MRSSNNHGCENAEMSDTDPKTCSQCGRPLPADAPGGLCPSCVMAMNLSPETWMSTRDSAAEKAPPPSPEEMAERFPNFEITECLGRGGMGVVYKAQQKALDREVAIKVLAGEWQDDPEFAKRFEREAKTLAQMSHPNIVTVHDFGEADGLYYIVMEYVDGVNLRDLLTDGKMAPDQALAIVPPICEALEYAHDKGVVHRDIKPENLLLDRDGRVKIADFGIASLVGPTTDVSGTPSYMAPEQMNGSVDRRADIYALGVVLYEMLTGDRPEKDVVAPSKKVELDVKIDEMVLRALEKEPERRYASATEFKTQVETIVAEAADLENRKRMSEDADVMKNKSQMVRLLEVVYGRPFTSPLAMKLANMSALGFLASLAFLGYLPIPGMRRCFAFAGFAGFFGLIGFAVIVEQLHRKKGGRRLERDSSGANTPDAVASPWPRRVFWLLASLVITVPLVLLAMLLAPLATRLGIGSVEATLWLTAAGALVILAFVPPAMVLVSLRRHPADARSPWLRRIALLLFAVPALLFGILVLVLVPWGVSRVDGDLPESVTEESRVPTEQHPEALQGHWLWEEQGTGDKVWLTLPEVGPASMQGRDLGGQLQFHRQFEWTVKEEKLVLAFGKDEATGELTQDGGSLRMETTKDERSVLFQKIDKAPPAIETDLVILEDLALHMIVAIREKDDQKLKSLGTDRIEDWPNALPVFAVELRERYRQLVGDEQFDLRATESMMKGDLGVVRCTGPEVLEGKCLVLSFVETPDGWKNCLLRNSTEDVELRKHLAELERQLDGAQLRNGKE